MIIIIFVVIVIVIIDIFVVIEVIICKIVYITHKLCWRQVNVTEIATRAAVLEILERMLPVALIVGVDFAVAVLNHMLANAVRTGERVMIAGVLELCVAVGLEQPFGEADGLRYAVLERQARLFEERRHGATRVAAVHRAEDLRERLACARAERFVIAEAFYGTGDAYGVVY